MGSCSVSVATDDIISFERYLGATTAQGTRSPFAARLEVTFRHHNIQDKPTKRVDRSLAGVALGLEMLDGTHWVPRCDRIYDIACGLRYLLEGGMTSQAQFTAFLGVLQWALLANRPLLSACHAVYSFTDETSTVPEHIPPKVRRELAVLTTLLFGAVIDMRAEWSSFIAATYGAEIFGYGGVTAHCGRDVTRQLASQSL